MNRRQVLAVLGAAGVAAAAYRVAGGGGMTARGVAWPRGRTPAVTPTADHYRVSKSALWPDPRIDAGSWRLDVHGQVARRLALSLDDLRAMPRVDQYATLACIGTSVPARAIGTALWTGVPLAAVLERAGITRAASNSDGRPFDLVFTGGDNYTDSIPLDRALHPGTLLAYAMNGEPLPRAHGAPLRAIVPGIYGMKNVKWIESIEIVAGDYLGYWQQRGWSDAAEYRTLSRIDEPRRGDEWGSGTAHVISGMAFAGDRGISRVDVEIAGQHADAALDAPLSPYTWVLWSLPWTPASAGTYTLRARAVDADGTPQIADPHPSFPDGATGLHTVDLVVR